MPFLDRVNRQYDYEVDASSQERYMAMFTQPMKDQHDLDMAAKEVRWARKNLKREDRIIWWLRQLKISMLLHDWLLVHEDKAYGEEFFIEQYRDPDYVEKYLSKNLPKGWKSKALFYYEDWYNFAKIPASSFESIKRNMQHYISNAEVNDYTSVLDYRFPPGESLPNVLEKLRALERADSEKKSPERLLQPEDDDEVFMRFPDGWAWWLLDREYCNEEGTAMEHCANSADPREGDQLLSLREPVRVKQDKWWKPHLTFIYNRGALGEMKGYRNQKPSSKFHKYIVPLLKDKRIKLIVGGGYKPENNFQLEDLPEKEREEVLRDNKGLSSLLTYYRKHGLDDTFRNALQRQMNLDPDEVLEFSRDGKDILFNEHKNAQEFAESHKDEELQWALKTFEEYVDLEPYSSDQLREDLLDEFEKKRPEKYRAFLKAVAEKYAEEFAEYKEEHLPHDWTIERLPHVELEGFISALETGFDHSELVDALDRAVYEASEIGYQNELYKTVVKYFNNYGDGVLHLRFGQNATHEKIDYLDDKIWEYVNIEQLLKAAEYSIHAFEPFHEGGYDTDDKFSFRGDYWEYDWDAGIERLLDMELYEIEIDI